MQESLSAPNPRDPSSFAYREALLRAVARCEARGDAESLMCATFIREELAQAEGAAEAPSSAQLHLDFEICDQLLVWNRQQSPTPITTNCEYAVGLEVLRLVRQQAQLNAEYGLPTDPGSPVLVAMGDNRFKLLPRELPESMLLELALVTDWGPDDEGESSERNAAYEGWQALLALAPEVQLPAAAAALIPQP